MSNRRAFTYVELMVVMTTIAILAAIAIPNFLEAKTRSVVARTKAELALLKMGIETYRLETRAYPPNRQAGVAGLDDLLVLTTPIAYLSHLPVDAFTSEEANQTRKHLLHPVPYRYFNALQVSPKEGLTYRHLAKPREAESDKLGGGLIAGLLWGYGPAGPYEGALFVPIQSQIPPSGEAHLIVYDPSNGTTSSGEIFQRIP